MRLVAVADMLDKRESNREKNALLDADRRHRRCGEKRQEEFARAFAPDVAEALNIDHADRDRKNDARQYAVRQVLQRAGQKQEHDEHDGGEGELRDLASRASFVRHGCLGRAAVDDESPLIAAPALAAANPKMSAFSSTRSLCIVA